MRSQRQRDAEITLSYLDGILARYAENRAELVAKHGDWWYARIDDLLDRRCREMERAA